MSTSATPTTAAELAEEASAWAVGAGIITMALFPLALPIILLTAAAAVPLLLLSLAVALVVAVVAGPLLLLRRLGRAIRVAAARRAAEPGRQGDEPRAVTC
jgi:hypothetical protein